MLSPKSANQTQCQSTNLRSWGKAFNCVSTPYVLGLNHGLCDPIFEAPGSTTLTHHYATGDLALIQTAVLFYLLYT